MPTKQIENFHCFFFFFFNLKYTTKKKEFNQNELDALLKVLFWIILFSHLGYYPLFEHLHTTLLSWILCTPQIPEEA